MKPKDKRKPETIIAELRRLLKQSVGERYTAEANRDAYRSRASKAETEAAEWKRRFDALLAAIPELRKVQG